LVTLDEIIMKNELLEEHWKLCVPPQHRQNSGNSLSSTGNRWRYGEAIRPPNVPARFAGLTVDAA
jgi:hypothetical protein